MDIKALILIVFALTSIPWSGYVLFDAPLMASGGMILACAMLYSGIRFKWIEELVEIHL